MTMADNTIHDLLDEVNCADSCEAVTALCALIDELLKDIQHLELECIGTRYLLSQHMEEEQGSLLREYSVYIMQLFRTFSAGHPEIRCNNSGCQCSPL